MRIINDRVGVDGRQYSAPIASEVAALIPSDFVAEMPSRDIIVQSKNTGRLQRISEIHPSYLPLQYPQILCFGEDGWRHGIEKALTGINNKNKRKYISMRQWFAFHLQERENECQTLMRSRRLFQQFIVDAYTAVESKRLSFIKKNQTKLRCTDFNSLKEVSAAGQPKISEQGNPITIPSSFTGGSWYMVNSYYDAMAICKHFGFPDLFITFTCNPKWPDTTRYCSVRGLAPDDRSGIVCRIFKIKLESLMRDLTERHFLGKAVASMYTVEFQKRGLPHAHILLFMDQRSKLPTADDIDKIICAEIPDKNVNPELYQVVKNNMIHGPCGAANYNSPCMVDGLCSKFYPKAFSDLTKIGKDGYAVYRRRRSNISFEKSRFQCDNRYVVPYNPMLSVRYRAHINVEWCNQSGSIKYLFKYINKGPDKVAVIFEAKDQAEKPKNEIKDYFDCRYVSTSEAIWRLFKFPIQYRSTPVERLSFHIEGKKPCIYDKDDELEDVLERTINVDSQLTAWFALNKRDSFSRTKLYAQIPAFYTWDGARKMWKTRSRGFSLGRINYVPRKLEAEYYVRMLLNIVPGAESFDDLRTYKKVVYKTYKEACNTHGILDDDQIYIDCLVESTQWCFGYYLRKFFAVLLLSGSLSSPAHVWDETWQILPEDIERKKRLEVNNPVLELTAEEKMNFTLQEIELHLLSNGSSLTSFEEMPQPNRDGMDISNRLIADERRYIRAEQAEDHDA
ncbi:PREDICTED: uncharacterized protein LOC104767971 [Camelina sativa]|uniref:Uncharacterized protein LOC104767971 n=1 Tax=Camelina sativa TaxID=90675 RepID=A0ABM0XS84_CAMSA|nr:PREDICTED: uncharacterized protein LOC104767971 [Camelina sativa]